MTIAADTANPRRPFLTVLAVFGGVGIVATIGYFLLASFLHGVASVPPAAASVAAYVACAVFSYWGHRRLSFASGGAHAVQVPRFVASTTLGLAVATATPLAADAAGLAPVAGYALVCLLVPALNFVLLSRWVFRTEAASAESLLPALPAGERLPIVLGVIATACLALFLQAFLWPMNADTSWLMTVFDRMHAGDRLYVDVIENNTPISVWVYAPPMELSYLTGLRAETLVNAYTLLVCLLGSGLTAWMARAGNLLSTRASAWMLLLLFFCGAVLSGNIFSERDHLGAVLFLPLPVLAAWRLSGSASRPGVRHWLVAGFAGGILAMFKPYYALLTLAAALYVVARRRDWRLLFLPEYLLAGALSAAYMGFFYLAYPAYFADLLPLLRETYLAFAWPFPLLARVALSSALIPAVYLLLRRRLGKSELSHILMLVSLVAFLPYFIQGKGWPYHLYAAIYLGSAAIVVMLCGSLTAERARAFNTREAVMLALVAVLGAHTRFMPADLSLARMANEVKSDISAPTMGVIGGNIATAFPFARMVDGRWSEPHCSDWIGVYALRMAGLAESAGNQAQATHFLHILDGYLAGKRERMAADPPEILLVEKDNDSVRIFLDRYGFAAFLENYTRLTGNADFDVYRRRATAGGPD
ncbi:MAG: GtrA family protein [Rhizobiales bacterium]|nr:GtrA family protein [Hyphomicrobiales bacterium]